MSSEPGTGESSCDEVATNDRAEVNVPRRRVPLAGAIDAGSFAKRSEDDPMASGPVASREAQHAEELAALDRKAAGWELAYHAAVRDRELATALVGRPLVPGAAAQLMKLWRDDFDAYTEDGEVRIASRDGLSVSQAIEERLAAPEYAHFSLPSSRGGAALGDRDSSRVAPAVGAKPAARTLGEAIVLQWREAQRRPKDPSASIGLSRRR